MKSISLQVKVVTLIILVLLISVTINLIITLNDHKNDLIKSNEKTLLINTNIINKVIQNLMLTGEAPLANKTMQDLENLPSLEEIVIYRTDGNRAFNDFTTLDRVNMFQDMYMFDKTDRIDNKIITNEYFQKVLKTNTPQINELPDSRELEYYFPILNYNDCRVCHGDEEFIRGIAHFKISLDSVYNQFNNSIIRNIIIFAIIGCLITLLLILLIKRSVLTPLNMIGEVVIDVGQGNLDRSINLKSKDELANLGNSINEMIVGLKDRNRLLIENKVIEATNRENKKYLDNIKDGLLLLNSELLVTGTFSTFFTELFEIDNPQGETLEEILYGEDETDKIKELRNFLDMLFNNPLADMEMIQEINPVKTVGVKTSSGKTIIVDAYFARIFNELDEIENIMVIFKDRTKFINTKKELEHEKEKSEGEIEVISSILKSGREEFNDFIKKFNKVVKQLSSGKINNSVKRDIHTLKGTSSYYNLNYLANLFHEVEDSLSITDDFNNSLENLKQSNKSFNDIFFRFDNYTLMSKESYADKLIRQIGEMVKKISFSLDKPSRLSYLKKANKIPYLNSLSSSIIHLIRNSLDHGIEDRFQRATYGKNELGTIFFNLKEDKRNYIIEIGDDGKGIDFHRIEQKAISKGLLKEGYHYDKSEILNILFTPGFSIKEDISELSGRGIGLDVVVTDINKLGGSLSVKTLKNVGTMFKISIPKE